MADRYAEHVAESRAPKTSADNPATSADRDLFFGLISETPEDGDLQSAFVGRMQRTRIYDDVVKPYANSRGRQYDIINRQMESMYGMFVIKGGWGVEKLLTILIVIMRAGKEINRWSVSRSGAIYDRGDIPMVALRGVSEDDFNYVSADAMSRHADLDKGGE